MKWLDEIVSMIFCLALLVGGLIIITVISWVVIINLWMRFLEALSV